MPAASLRKLDTTSQSWLDLPNTQGVTGYPCVCLLLAAQLLSWALAVSLVSLSQTCCFYRRHTCATSASCASEAVHRKGVLVDLLCSGGPPLKHRVALGVSVGARTSCWSDRYLWALLYNEDERLSDLLVATLPEGEDPDEVCQWIANKRMGQTARSQDLY